MIIVTLCVYSDVITLRHVPVQFNYCLFIYCLEVNINCIVTNRHSIILFGVYITDYQKVFVSPKVKTSITFLVMTDLNISVAHRTALTRLLKFKLFSSLFTTA